MADFDAKAEIESLRAMLSDVVSKQNRAALPPTVPVEASSSAGASVVPFWDVVTCSGLTLTVASSVDWSVLFDNTSATSWRKFHVITSHGDLDFGALGLGPQRRFSISWESKNAASVECILAGAYVEANDTDWPIQIKLNGVMTEYPVGTPQLLPLEIKAGVNELIISTETRPATVQFYGCLWDETLGDKWIDPRTSQTYIR